MTGPLAPYRVLDLTDEKGWFAGRMLADMGADVIKCEPPGGDPGRRTGPFYKDVPDIQKSLSWFEANAGKRGITLNVASADGRDLLRKLLPGTDMLIESFDPGYLRGLGLGYDQVADINPRLIMTSITPFGQEGPKAGYCTTELTRWASTGVMYCSGDADRPPNWIGVPQSRIHGCLEACLATLVALHYRSSNGLGQYVDVSMQAAGIDALMDTLEMWLLAGIDYRRSSFSNITSNKGVAQKFALRCKDGYAAFFTLGGGVLASAEHLGRVREWMKEEITVPDWFQKIDFVRDYDSAAIDQELVDRVQGTIEAFLMTKTKAEILRRALDYGLIAAPIQDAAEVWQDEQLAARGFWVPFEQAGLPGPVPYPGAFAKFSGTPLSISRPAPRIGEHNEEVYEEELGLSRERLAFLKKVGAI